jgi:predicted RND superfamily exporter protein
LMSRDETKVNIKFDFKDHKSSTVNLVVEKTKEFLEKHPMPSMKFSYAGGDIGILYATNEIIAKTLMSNTLFASALMFLYVAFAYRSFVAGIFLFVPLIFSNLIVYAIYGFSGTSITTEMLPLVALSEGLGIDFGFYILARMYDELRERKDRPAKEILQYTLTTSGKAVFFSGSILSVGIFMWVLSPILFQVRLGLNLCLALVLSMVVALVMIPVLVWWIKPKFLFGDLKTKTFK